MKPRKNPTDEQMLRRLRSGDGGQRDPRVKKDAYWALRAQGHPHSFAVRAHRDIPPLFYREQPATSGEYIDELDPSDLLFPDKTDLRVFAAYVRPSLSEDAIREAAPREHEYTIWDENIPSFGVRIRPSGVKSYVVMFRIAGHRTQGKLTIGRAGEIPLELARRIARDCRLEAHRGMDPRKPDLLRAIWERVA